MTLTPLRHSLTGDMSEFDATWLAHGSDCADCLTEAWSAAITARVTGSVGCTHSTNSETSEHGATVKRVRCHASNSRANGGDCLCPVCKLPDGAYYVNPDAPEEGYDIPLEVLAAREALAAATRMPPDDIVRVLNILTEAGFEIRRINDD